MADTSKRQGRWLVLALAVVPVLGVGGVALAQRYEPLERGSWSGIGDGKRVQTESGEEQVELPYSPGRTGHVIVSVRNSGRFAVTIDGIVPDVSGGFGLVGATGLSAEGRGTLQDEVGLPFRLAPGKEVALRLTVQLPRCGVAAGSGVSVATVPVLWHAFRSSHVTSLPMTPVSFSAPADASGASTQPCPS